MTKNTMMNAAIAALCICAGVTLRADLLEDVCDADRRADAAIDAIKTPAELAARQGAWRTKGWECIAAAHAYAAEPQLFSGVEFADPPPSWTEMVTNPDPSNDSFAVGVWGALEEYDWPDLAPLSAMSP